MKIGDLALATSTPTETIRFYEREQLLAPAARTESNYRIYGDEHAAQLTFIRHCRSLDMTLDEIRVLLRFRESPQENCSRVNEVLDEHIGHVAQRIRELRALEKQLIRLRDQCSEANAARDCGILKGLAAGVTPRVSAPKGRKHVHGTH